MKTLLQNKRASALVTVVIFCGVLALLATSMLRYSAGERRGNERNRLILRAKNQAENITVYAADQLSSKLYRMGSAPKMKFTWSGTGSKRLYPPPDSVLNSNFTSASSIEMRAGIESASDYVLVSDTTDPNNGLQVSKARVPIIAKATATHASLGSVTSYVEQDMEMALTPLFQFGMFYNMDLELYPSVAMNISGPVHSNKRLMAKPNATADIDLRFLNRVTCAQGLYAEAVLKAYTRDTTGGITAPVSSPDSTATGHVYFTPTSGAAVDLKNSSSKWRDHKYTQTTESATTIANFKTFATNTYGGNLRTSAHGVTALQLPGIGTYQETDDPATPDVDERNNGRQIIEPPNPPKWNSSTSTWDNTTDDADEIASKISYKAGLYIVSNPDYHATPRKGTLPDGTTAWVTPGSYRAWLNAADSDGNRSCTEVVLPGQPSYGYNSGPDGTLGTADDYQYRNYLPNRYTAQSVGGDGNGNQVLRVPQSGYGIGSGYLVNGAHNTTGVTTVAVDTGTGRILAGEVIKVGTTYRYVVAEDYAGGSGNLKIMQPGLLATIPDNTALTIEPWGLSNVPSPAYSSYKSSGTYAVGTTKIDLRLTGSGTGGAIIPGTVITIGSYKYLVTAAAVSSGITTSNYGSTSYTIGIAPLQASLASLVSTSIDATMAFDLGTGLGYRVNGAVAAGGTTVTLGTGSGTVLPGDTLFIGGTRFLVTSTASTPPSSAPTVQIYPAAPAAIATDTVAIVDPFKKSGYSRSTAYPVANMGRDFPVDATAPYGPADAYFFDMRRANANSGHTGYATAGDSKTQARYDRKTYPYEPRAIAKVDFDMTRFRMFVDRVMNSANTSSIYDVRVPSGGGGSGVWNNSIFNASGARASFGLGTGSGSTFTTMPTTTNSDTKIRLDPYNLYYAPAAPEGADLSTVVNSPMDKLVPISALFNDAAPDAWYDGLAVYLHSLDAEKRKQTSGVPDRVDSGVRLWNGRGPVISLSTATKTGFTFVTNDAVYIVGHFNADGTIDSSSTDTGTGSPNYYGGYSGTYPDGSEEKLCAVMGDAFTALSQPTWSTASGGQTGGWNDALSALCHTGSNSSGWRSTSTTTSVLPTGTDGLYMTANIYPGLLPNQSYSGTIGTSGKSKLSAVVTEMSTALLMGIVPSNHDPRELTDGYVRSTMLTGGVSPVKAGNGVNSGGANNYPRLMEAWSTTNALYIRGSIVGLFESRVAMEPFTDARCYSAPGRFWGLHYNFSQAKHDVPLEPIVIGSNRVGFRELTKAEYTAMKAQIEALP